MKKLIILSAAGLLAFAANAQRAQRASSANVLVPAVQNSTTPYQPAIGNTPQAGAKGAIASAFITDTFSSASLTTGGWTTGGNTSPDSWKVATSGTNYLSTLFSTTRNGGYMLYDAFGIGALHPNTQPVQFGYLTSPSYSCTGHSYVGLRFQQYYRKLVDSCLVFVSTDNFATYTQYPVSPNNTLLNNGETDDPQVTTINISATAANQPNVRIRFQYSGRFSGTGTNGSAGTYGWSIDDFQLLDLDQVDLATRRSATVTPLHNDNGYTTFGSIPRVFVDSLLSLTSVSNYGGTSQSAVAVNSNIMFGATTITNTRTLSSIAVNVNDSLLDFRAEKGLAKPATTGTVITTNVVNQPGDGTPANNVDTVLQNISDSVWYAYRPGASASSGFYVQRGANNTTTPPTTAVGFYTGTLYEVGAGKTDTLTSVDIAFHPITVAGGQIRIVIYKLDQSDPANPFWDFYGNTVTRTVAAADIPASGGSIIWTKFYSKLTTSTSNPYTVLKEGEYGIVVQGVNLPASNTTVILNTKGPTPLVGRFGLSDTLGAAFGTRVSENETVPMMRVNFSNNAKGILNPVGIANVAIATSQLSAFPNPASDEIAVSFKLINSGQTSVRLTNTMGQVVASKDLGNLVSGQKATAIFNTVHIADGLYYYSVESAGARSVGRVIVKH